MKVTIIINPVSGYRGSQALLNRVSTALTDAGFTVTIEPTRGPGDATRIASEAPEDSRAVLALGGDGTVRETAIGLLNRNIPLVAVPGGTENIFAKHFRMTARPDEIINRLRHGTPRTIDVGTVNGSPYIIMVGAGFDAECVRRLTATRTGHITHFTYFWPIWRTFWGNPFKPIRVIADDKTIHDGPGFVVAGHLPRYSSNMGILAKADPADGLMDVCVYAISSRFRALLLAAKTWLRTHPDAHDVIYTQCRHLTIESDQPIPMQNDGDFAGYLPARCEVLPAALQILDSPQE